MERWKAYPGDTRYEVSDLGRVRRADNGYVRKLVPLKNGYLTAQLSRGAKSRRTLYVHRMVWETFAGPIPPGMEVRHGPNGKADNRYSELRLGTHQENVADKRDHGTEPTGADRWNSKLTEEQVADIRSRIPATITALAEEFGVSRNTIKRVLIMETYR